MKLYLVSLVSYCAQALWFKKHSENSFSGVICPWVIAMSFCSGNLLANQKDFKRIADDYRGIAYRADGATNAAGEFVTFNRPKLVFATPGLNCSGFLLDFARKAFGQHLTIEAAKVDRLSDSGPGADWGQDWDFGRDLVLNITAGNSIYAVLPSSHKERLWKDGLPLRGFDIHNRDLLEEVIAGLNPGDLYFVVISKPWRKKIPYRLLHYHVGLLIPADGEVFFYHASKLSGTHGYAISNSKGLDRFQYQFRKSVYGVKTALVVGVRPYDQPVTQN